MRRRISHEPVEGLPAFADPKAIGRLDALISRRFPEKGKMERIRRAQKFLKSLWKTPVRLSRASIDRIANAPYYEDR